VAVDPVGIRQIIAASEMAKQKKLAIVAGTQRRHQAHYVEIMKRIHDGAIGEIVSGQCYWTMGGLWVIDRTPQMSDMEYQIRNWLYYTWLSGDHIVEQHVHNLDVMNWAIGRAPEKIMGMGGRQARTAPQYGNIFDHFALDVQYADGLRVMSACRQIDGASSAVCERIIGTKGYAYLDSATGYIKGKNAYQYEDKEINPYVQEHTDLIASIRAGKPLNEGRQVAESTLVAIMGRMSAYTGRDLQWSWAMNASKLDLRPPKYEMGPLPVPPVAIPGKTVLV
jgi:myo-inositol 2-dehydrogenase / D-chiro-inositol 1-dehydrogenase